MQKNRLTLYIFIALVLGIVAGYLYNSLSINAINERINIAQVQLKTVGNSMSGIKDTTDVDYKMLTRQQSILTGHIKENETLQESF